MVRRLVTKDLRQDAFVNCWFVGVEAHDRFVWICCGCHGLNWCSSGGAALLAGGEEQHVSKPSTTIAVPSRVAVADNLGF